VNSPFEVVLHGPQKPIAAGQKAPIRIEVRNSTDADVWIVGVVDGSEDGVRCPHYRPAVLLGDDVVAEPPPPEDPLVGPLRQADFRRLSPGESFDPTNPHEGAAYHPLATFATFRAIRPGVYRFTLTISSDCPDPEQWLGAFGQDAEREAVLGLVAQVPAVTVTASVDVEVQ
jgi:hypothetical protein